MKKQLCLALTCIASICTTYGQQNFNAKYLKEGMYFFDDIQKYTKTSLFTIYKQEFGLSANDSLALVYNVTDSNGRFDCKYAQYHKGIKVEDGAMFVHGDKEIALCANGRLIKNLSVNTSAIIPEGDALQTALSFIGAAQYLWEDSLSEALLKEESGDPAATNFPKGELIITKSHTIVETDTPANFRLCYKFSIVALQPNATIDVYVDALLNTVFTAQQEGFDDIDATGTAWTWYYGWVNNLKTATCTGCSNFKLRDIGRNIETRGIKIGTDYYKDGDNDWVSTSDKNGASSHWGAARAYDYYKKRFDRKGTDFSNKRIRMFVGAEGLPPGTTAAWNFDGGNDNIKLRPNRPSDPVSASALDIIAHELTHGMHNATSRIGSNRMDYDAACMNEAFADIMGVAAEGYTLGSYDWSMGEKSGTYQRRFDNPRLDWGMPTPSGASPDTYLGADWLSAGEDGRHSNTGVWRKWFYLTVNGGVHNFIGVPGMGITRTEGLTYLASNWWFWANLRHTEAAKQLENAVKYYTRDCSNDHKTVARALRAVGFSNIAIPFCMKVIIKGDKVIEQSNANLHPRMFVAEINEMTSGGTVTWNIPAGWTATAQGNTLTVTHFGSFDSKVLSVTYASPSLDVSTDSLVVHFSNEPWVPEHAPEMPYFITSHYAPLQEEKITIFPNPANNVVNIQFMAADPNSTATITDVAGKIIRTLNLQEQNNKIDLHDLSNGSYFLKVQHKNTSRVQQIVLMH